jgi:hypothetical protein
MSSISSRHSRLVSSAFEAAWPISTPIYTAWQFADELFGIALKQPGALAITRLVPAWPPAAVHADTSIQWIWREAKCSGH